MASLTIDNRGPDRGGPSPLVPVAVGYGMPAPISSAGSGPPPSRTLPPNLTTVGPPAGMSAVTAFDRPVSVIVVGPRPLEVKIVGGLPGGGSGGGGGGAGGPASPAGGFSYASVAGAATRGAIGWARGQPGAAENAGGAIGSTLGGAAGMALGGPIGAAVGQVVGKEVGEKIGARIDDPLLEMTKTFKAVGEGARFTGDMLVKLAGNDGIGMVTQAAGAAADGLEKVPVVGKAAAEGLRTFNAVLTAGTQVVAAFNERAREIGGYSGRIAEAVARQDVARLQADIREAQRLGDQYANVVQKTTQIELMVREGLLPLKEAVIGQIAPTLDALITALIAGLRLAEMATPGFQLVFGKMSEDLREIRRKAEEGGLGGDVVTWWMDGLDKIEGPKPPKLPPVDSLPPPAAFT